MFIKRVEIYSVSILIFLVIGCNKPQEILPSNSQLLVITGLSRSSGGPGVVFQIQGDHFDINLSGNEVKIGENILRVISVTGNSLEVQIPNDNTLLYGTFRVSVKVRGTTAFSPTDFTLERPSSPTISNLTGYTDRTSYRPGEVVKVYLSSDVVNSHYQLGVYDVNRNLIFSSEVSIAPQVPTSIRPWSDGFGFGLTASVTIPSGMKSGFYLIENKIPLVVKPSQPVDIIVVYPSNTENAYCESGGRSLYSTTDRPSQVSFDRPVLFPNHSVNFSEYGLKWLLEQTDLSIGYVCDHDLEDYNNISNAKLLLLIGHSEYWTRQARNNFDQFVESGKHVLILSGNTMWWQVRYSADGNALVCYKDGAADPIQDPRLKTITWNTNSLEYSGISSIGADFEHGGYGLRSDHGWNGFKIVSPGSPLLQGTGLKKGDVLRLPTVEYDGAATDGFGPDGSPVLNTALNNFYKIELIGFDKGFRGNSETIGTFIVLQRSPSSGIIVNTATTDWCSANGMGGQDQIKIKTITRNAILKLLNDENVFSGGGGSRGGV